MADTILMPKLGFDMREGILVRWVKAVGESIKKGDVIAEIETDKATVEVESSASGVVRKLLAEQGDSVPVGALMAIVGTSDEDVEFDSPGDNIHAQRVEGETEIKADIETSSMKISEPGIAEVIKASPLARKMSREAKIDLGNVKGTGPGGRIVRRDVEAARVANSFGNLAKVQSQGSPLAAQRYLTLPVSKPEDVTLQTSKLRQAIGRRLVESKQKVPHFYVTNQFNVDALLDLRNHVNSALPDGEKISLNDFIVKAVALALRKFPNLNSTLSGQEIVQHGDINVGVAVTVPGGLMTVVVRNTDSKPLRQISSELKNLAKRARDGKVKQEDVEGSTFSTSNLGMFDVENFIAIVNPPEAAILAIGSAIEAPIVKSGQLAVGYIMKCTISVDHRISDGAEAAQFMQALTEYIEEPLRCLL